MKNALLVHAAQISASNMGLSVLAFAKATGLDAKKVQEIAFLQGAMPIEAYKAEQLHIIQRGAIYQYKIGYTTTDKFIAAMNAAFKAAEGKELSSVEFISCWNAMSTISEATLGQLAALAKLQAEHKFGVHVIASSNPLHDRYIAEQLQSNGINIQLTFTNSFDKHTLDKGTLLGHAKADIADSAAELVEVIDLRDNDKRPLIEVVQEVLKETRAEEEMAKQQAVSAASAAKQPASIFPRFTATPAKASLAAGADEDVEEAVIDGSDEEDEPLPVLTRVKSVAAAVDLKKFPEESESEADDEDSTADGAPALSMSMLQLPSRQEAASAAAVAKQGAESSLFLFRQALQNPESKEYRRKSDAASLEEFGVVYSPRTALNRLAL